MYTKNEFIEDIDSPRAGSYENDYIKPRFTNKEKINQNSTNQYLYSSKFSIDFYITAYCIQSFSYLIFFNLCLVYLVKIIKL